MFLKTLAGVAAALVLAACGPQGRATITNVKDDAFMGPADAKVTVIEYGSPTCPACKQWHDTFWDEVKRDYITPGKIKFIFREYAIHGAIDAGVFTIARCAGTEDYFKVLDAAFENQQAIAMSAQRGTSVDELKKLGAKFGFSGDQVVACMNDKENIKRVNDVGAYTRQIGVNSTPTFFVDGVEMPDSNWTAIKAAIDAALSGQPVAPTPIAPPADALPATDDGHGHAPGETH